MISQILKTDQLLISKTEKVLFFITDKNRSGNTYCFANNMLKLQITALKIPCISWKSSTRYYRN